MIPIDLDEFVQKVRDYQSSPYAVEMLYSDTLRRREVWDNLAQIDVKKTEDVVLYFLNAWKCRLSYTCSQKLTDALKEAANFLDNLKNVSLERVPLKFLIDDNNTQHAFKIIASVKAGKRTVGATATSKILHMVNPNLFIMADENTRFGYGCSENELGYVNFMWRTKLVGDALIDNYSRERNLPKDKAFQKLASECQSNATALPKLIDEYNWVKYNQ